MSQRITLKQVAAQAGVSYQTVSKVLNGQVRVSKQTEQRIWEAARLFDYHPNQLARSLRSQRSHLIGYSWVPAAPGEDNPILDQFMQSMALAAENAGYQLLAFPHRPGTLWTEGYRTLIETNRVDGFVLSSVEYNDARIVLLQEQGFPFVAFGRSNPGWEFPSVDIDGAAGMRSIVEHLLSLGHRRIAALAWPESSRVGQNRIEGYFSGLEYAGITPAPEWILRGEGIYLFGLESTSRFLEGPADQRPTAIIGFNDVMAIGAIHAVQQKGYHVGTDVAITGFDDLPMSQYLTPPLTSVSQPTWEVGQRVIELLVKILNGGPLIQAHVLLSPQIIIRQSTNPIVMG